MGENHTTGKTPTKTHRKWRKEGEVGYGLERITVYCFAGLRASTGT
jgi:hypothetical protein